MWQRVNVIYKHCRRIWLPRYIASSLHFTDLRQLLLTVMASFTIICCLQLKAKFFKELVSNPSERVVVFYFVFMGGSLCSLEAIFRGLWKEKKWCWYHVGWNYQYSYSSVWDATSLFGNILPAISMIISLGLYCLQPWSLHDEEKDILCGASNDFERLCMNAGKKKKSWGDCVVYHFYTCSKYFCCVPAGPFEVVRLIISITFS